MKLEALNQEVQFVFSNSEKYGDHKKSRIFKNVAQGVNADQLNKVGIAIADLQGDELSQSVLVLKKAVVSE